MPTVVGPLLPLQHGRGHSRRSSARYTLAICLLACLPRQVCGIATSFAAKSLGGQAQRVGLKVGQIQVRTGGRAGR